MLGALRQTGILTAVILACAWLAYSGPGYVDAPNLLSYLVLLVLLTAMFLAIFHLAVPGPLGRYAAVFGVALYGLNPGNAWMLLDFTRRPIIWSTLGMAAALALYQWRPGWRKYGVYLLPVAAAACFHRATLAFAPLLFAFTLLCEKNGEWRSVPGLILRCIPGLLVSCLALVRVTAGPAIPVAEPLAGWGVGLRLLILIGAAVSTAMWRASRGVSFGLWWLLILMAIVPGEPLPAGIGVALAVSIALARIVERLPALAQRWVPAGCACLLIVSGVACGQAIDTLPWTPDRVRVLQSRDPIDWLRVSVVQYNGGRFTESIAAAGTALRLKRDSVEAYNNMYVAFTALKKWDQAIQVSQEALRLKPGDPLARERLVRAQEQKRRGSN